ncbi:hypothetical protein MKW92_041312 [Papaver armeniacum]|nr:hypothetical protein MKW92_041312 [Papaver armeniacum]
MKMSPIFVLAFLLSALLVVVISQNTVKADEELEPVWCIANLAASKEKIPCYLQKTLKDHASYAFNNYYQKFKFHGASCNFGGAAIITKIDPSKISNLFPKISSLQIFMVSPIVYKSIDLGSEALRCSSIRQQL